MASTSPESQGPGQPYGPSKIKITFLASEWVSSKGGLSTISRELAIQLAKCPDVDITFFVPKCNEEDKNEAHSRNVRILKATRRPGFKELEWLTFPPEDLQIDVIVGNGVKLGRQAQVIRRTHKCKWVQVVHTDPERLGMFKSYANAILTGEEKHVVEVELCEMADFVVGVGPKLTEVFRSYLRWCQKDQTIFNFTPGVFDELTSVEQVVEERKHCSVLVFDREDTEDFELKGFDIAGRAVSALPDTHLVFVGAPDGKHDEIAQRLLQCDLPANRLKVRSYVESRESLKRLFCEVDLVLMPARTEGFGLTGLEALSAGLPVLVSKNSGFGEALRKVPFGSSFVIDSGDPKIWAAAIKSIWDKDRQCRLKEAELLRMSYEREYSWIKQSYDLLANIRNLPRVRLQLHIDCETIARAGTKERASRALPGQQEPEAVVHQVGVVPITSSQSDVVDRNRKRAGNGNGPSSQDVLNFIASKCFKLVDPSKPEELNGFLEYLEKVRKVLLIDSTPGSLIVTVECSSLQILDKLWQDYRSGDLNEMAQKFLVTEDTLEELGLVRVKLKTTIARDEYRACRQYFLKRVGKRKSAIPLCLPNNWRWIPEMKKCEKINDKRSSLYVIHEALEQLRKVKGPVCVVSIAGTYRKGKSYILSEAFDQQDVFPLGHEMDPETVGIWLWIVPEKYKDANGREFTVVLLDSEGIDSTSNRGFQDHQIFTLTVLLASVLIYNSQGVPTRSDVGELDFIVKLSQRIKIRTGSRFAYTGKDTELFHQTFPYFIWLLRDVTQSIPTDCVNIKDYFLRKVFKDKVSSDTKGKRVAESILRFFSGFNAFMLPSPSVDPETMKCLTQKKSEVNPSFISALNEFKCLMKTVLAPKNSFTDGELVTGQGLAALLQQYVHAINTGEIPNMQTAWDTYVGEKFREAKQTALEMYSIILSVQLKENLPCDNNDIRLIHNEALLECEDKFITEVAGISTDMVEEHIGQLKRSMESKLSSWQAENEKQTREYCEGLLSVLKNEHLDPVLEKLQGKEAARVSFGEVISAYHKIKEDYEKNAKGAKHVIAAVFFEFHPELLKEKDQYLGLLRQLKDFDEELSRELAAKAYQERERKRLEEQQCRLQKDNCELRRQMELMIKNLEEEKKRFREQIEAEKKAQQDRLNNMKAASIIQAQEERKAFIEQREVLKVHVMEMQKYNEENMERIKQMSELAAKQDEEKEELLQQISDKGGEDKEALIKEVNERHVREMKALRDEMNAKLHEVMASAPKVEKDKFRTPGLMNKRTKEAGELHDKSEEIRKLGKR